MHVCFLINSLTQAGAETMVLRMVEDLPSDISPTVCYLRPEDALADDFRAAGAQVVSLQESFPFDPRAISRLYRLLCNYEIDVLHCHLPYAQILGRLIGRASGVSVLLSTQHSIPAKYHPIIRVLDRLTQPLDDVTVAVSKAVEHAHTGGKVRNDWVTIPNGIDVDGFRTEVAQTQPPKSMASDSLHYLNVGRCVKAKDQRTLIRAMAHLKEDPRETHLHILGDGPRREYLHECASSLGLEEYVTFHGHVREIAPFYNGADVFVLSSIVEGLPITLLEAMAAELPVVATEIPGIKEVVDNGNTGTLVPTKNPRYLAETMREMFDVERRSQMGAAGLNRAKERYSINQTIDKHVELYRRLVV